MWIRSQSKEVLKFCSNIKVDESSLYSGGVLLGKYATKQKAVEVLETIQDRIMNGSRFDEIQNGRRKTSDFVFQMPEE